MQESGVARSHLGNRIVNLTAAAVYTSFDEFVGAGCPSGNHRGAYAFGSNDILAKAASDNSAVGDQNDYRRCTWWLDTSYIFESLYPSDVPGTSFCTVYSVSFTTFL